MDIVAGLFQCFGNALLSRSHKGKVGVCGAAAGGIEAVVRGDQRDITAGDGDIYSLQPLVAFGDADGTAGDIQRVVGVNAVVAGGNGQVCTVRDGERPGTVEPIVHGVHGNGAAGDGHISIGFQALGGDSIFVLGGLGLVEPARETKFLGVLRGIGRAAGSGDREIAGQQRQVGAGLDAV